MNLLSNLKEVKAIKTSDNKIFFTKEEALEHEKQIFIFNELRPLVATIIKKETFEKIKDINTSRSEVIDMLTISLAKENAAIAEVIEVRI